jgi:hypothetical protein
VDGTIDDNDINGASSVDVERHDAHDEAAEATDNRTDGEVTSTAATAVAVSSLHSRNQIGDVNELFNLTEDIDDILGLDDDFESSIATANVFEVNNATGGTAENMSSSARENEEHENEIYDLDGRGEIHEEIDDAPTFVGIDGMIVDDEDDSDNGETTQGPTGGIGNNMLVLIGQIKRVCWGKFARKSMNCKPRWMLVMTRSLPRSSAM